MSFLSRSFQSGRRAHQRVGTKQNLSHNYMPGRASHHGCSASGRSSGNINPWKRQLMFVSMFYVCSRRSVRRRQAYYSIGKLSVRCGHQAALGEIQLLQPQLWTCHLGPNRKTFLKCLPTPFFSFWGAKNFKTSQRNAFIIQVTIVAFWHFSARQIGW